VTATYMVQCDTLSSFIPVSRKNILFWLKLKGSRHNILWTKVCGHSS